MISSTVNDLTVERAAASQAIGEFQFDRFQSETMGSSSLSSQELCEEAARECDLMILILGSRYGYIIPNLDISVTEREWQVAKLTEREKILIYVKADPAGKRESRQTDFINRATDFSSGHFRAPLFSEPTELKKRIKEDMAAWLSRRIVTARVSHRSVLQLGTLKENLSVVMGTIGITTLLSLTLKGIAFTSDKYWFIDFSLRRISDALPLLTFASFYFGMINLFVAISVLFCAISISASLIHLAPRKPTAFFAASHLNYLSLLLGPIALLAHVFWPIIFGISNWGTSMVPAFIAALAYSFVGLRSEINGLLLTQKSEPLKLIEIMRRIVISPTFPQITILVSMLRFGSGYLYTSDHLSEILRESLVYFRVDETILVVNFLCLTIAGAWATVRSAQSVIGDDLISEVILTRKHSR